MLKRVIYNKWLREAVAVRGVRRWEIADGISVGGNGDGRYWKSMTWS